MRTHLQGILILALVLVALWGLTRLASPTFGEAFGDNGAVTAATLDEDLVELTIAGVPVATELTEDEVSRLQFQLLRAGFLDDQADIDGMLGPTTRAAIDAAAKEWGLTDIRPRAVLLHADELFADQPVFGTS